MSDWRTQLRAQDPAAEPMMTERRQQMRRVVVEAARMAAPRTWPASGRLALAAAALAMVAVTAGNDRHPASGDLAPLPRAHGERRQVQFATPGGTRIIWEINPAFSLTETLP